MLRPVRFSSSEPVPRTPRVDLRAPISIWLVSRLGLLLLGWIAPKLLPPVKGNPSLLPHSDPLAGAYAWFGPWFRFDAAWYVDVARHGYRYGAIPHTNTNFFPVYPLLVHVLRPVTLNSYWLSALIVANVSFLAALLLLYAWAAHRWDEGVAVRVVLILAVFPFSFFFAAPYAESLFLALTVASFLAAERDQWVLAAGCASLSAVTRPVGLAVIAALVLWPLQAGRRRQAALCCCAVIPFLLYVAYLGVTVGQPLGFAVYHTDGWVAPQGGLLHTVERQFHTGLSPFDRIDAALSALFVVFSAVVWCRVGASYALFVLAGVALPLSRGLAGMERYVIVLFPVMAVWALARNKGVQLATFAVSLFLLVVTTCMFATGYALF